MRTVIRAIAPTRAKEAKTISIQPRISFGGWVQRSQPKRSRSPAQLHAGNRRRYEGLCHRMLREILTYEPIANVPKTTAVANAAEVWLPCDELDVRRLSLVPQERNFWMRRQGRRNRPQRQHTPAETKSSPWIAVMVQRHCVVFAPKDADIHGAIYPIG